MACNLQEIQEQELLRLKQLGIKRVTINICKGCYELKPGQCHEPDCILCRKTAKEAAFILDAIHVRPIVDGKVLPLG